MKQALHLKSGNMYRIISENHKVQIGDVWHDAVLYEADDRNHHGTTFTRTLLDFNMKFRRVNKKPGRRQDGFQSSVPIGRSHSAGELSESPAVRLNTPYEG